MARTKKIVIANEFRLTDQNGTLKALLSAGEQETIFSLKGDNQKDVIKLSVGSAGFSSLTFFDPADKERIQLGIDDHGIHIHLAGDGKQQSYIFLKSNAASGFVLTDVEGNRRVEAFIGPDSKPHVTIFPSGEEPKGL